MTPSLNRVGYSSGGLEWREKRYIWEDFAIALDRSAEFHGMG
jgi:hypothetical protein